MKPTILTPEWVRKKKELSEGLMRRGKVFCDLERWKRKCIKVI